MEPCEGVPVYLVFLPGTWVYRPTSQRVTSGTEEHHTYTQAQCAWYLLQLIRRRSRAGRQASFTILVLASRRLVNAVVPCPHLPGRWGHIQHTLKPKRTDMCNAHAVAAASYHFCVTPPSLAAFGSRQPMPEFAPRRLGGGLDLTPWTFVYGHAVLPPPRTNPQPPPWTISPPFAPLIAVARLPAPHSSGLSTITSCMMAWTRVTWGRGRSGIGRQRDLAGPQDTRPTQC